MCFVPGCANEVRLDSIKNIISDSIIKDKWIEAIGREDKILDSACQICENHFTEDDIIKGTTVKYPDGKEEIIEKARSKWVLKPGAVPSINLDLGTNDLNFLIWRKQTFYDISFFYFRDCTKS